MADSDYTVRGSGALTSTAFLTSDIEPLTTVVAIQGLRVSDSDDVKVGMAAMIDDEIVRIDAFTLNEMTIARGCADTIPSAHEAGTPVWLFGSDISSDRREYLAGETVGVKVLPHTPNGVPMSIAAVPPRALTFNQRFFRPYPPAEFKCKGDYWYTGVKEFETSDTELLWSWNHRDRLLQADQLIDHNDADIGPELGTTYTARVYNNSNVLVRTVTGIAGKTWAYPRAQAEVDLPGGAGYVIVCSVRDGVESLQSYRTNIQINSGGNGYEILRSLRLRASASAYLSRTPSSAGNRKTWTWSGWHKRGALQNTWLLGADDGILYSQIQFFEDRLRFGHVPSTDGTYYGWQTQAVFHDTSAWHHIVCSLDTTQVAAANRIRIYVDGVEQTSLVDVTGYGAIPQNTDTFINAALPQMIGRFIRGANNQMEGYLAEVNFIDGQALTATSFAQYDENGNWQPKAYEGGYGANGFKLTFSDPTDLATLCADNSGNSNNWTATNISLTPGVTYDSILDTPTSSLSNSVDPHFANVSLLLHLDGANDSNTFIDSSATAKTVTALGDAKISTTQSKFGGASGLFDGAGDSLLFPSSADFDLGDKYTIEFFVYNLSASKAGGILHRGFYTTGSNSWNGLTFSIRGLGTTVRFYFYATASTNEQFLDVSGAMPQNAWQHVAMVRDGAVGRVYLDGVLAGTISGLNVPAASTQPLKIGVWDYSSGAEYFNGHLDDIRITKGVARYTTNFIPPALPSPDLAGYIDPDFDKVALLLHMDGVDNSTTFIDSSGVARTATALGNAKISTAQSKFGGASGYFDGTGDAVRFNSSPDFGFSSVDFTIECFVFPVGTADSEFVACRDTTEPFWFFRRKADGTVRFYAKNSSTVVVTDVTTTQTVPTNAWCHVAVCRLAGVVMIFINGVPATLSGTNLTTPYLSPVAPLFVGAGNPTSNYFTGHIDEVRITKGKARYTAAFAPPALPFANKGNAKDPNFANVSLLLHMDGANNATTFIDSSPTHNAFSVIGVAKISTTQSKFGGSSLFLNGTDSRLVAPHTVHAEFAGGDFTVECFYNFATGKTSAAGYNILVAQDRLSETSNRGWILLQDGDVGGKMTFACRVGEMTYAVRGATPPPLNTWRHIAAVRHGSTLTIFEEGVATGTLTISGSINAGTGRLSVGNVDANVSGTSLGSYVNGYIDEVRITKGVARYTTNFIPPALAFPNA